jgi:hypothetical protein
MNATTSQSLDAPAIISLRNYRHLAGHHGHDLAVSIYGGDVSAALECETCNSILVAFENTPSQEAILAALVAFTRRLHIEPQHLASHLTAAAKQRAAAINEDGLDAQLTYLLETLGAQPAHDLITRIAAETRRG